MILDSFYILKVQVRRATSLFKSNCLSAGPTLDVIWRLKSFPHWKIKYT